jgi:putative ABC transport system permease protein
VPHRQNVYRLNEYVHYDGTTPQLSAAIGPPIAGLLKNDHSEIESFTRVFNAAPEIVSSVTMEYNGKKISSARLACTDTSFAAMFGMEIVAGDRQHFIPAQNSIALTETMAHTLFGNEPALNKMIKLRVDDTTVLRYAVTQVIKDFPKNSHLQLDALAPVPAEFEESFLGRNYGVLLGPTYLRLREGTDIAALEEKLTRTIHTKNPYIDMRLQPLSSLHTGSAGISYDFFNHNKIDGKYLNVFIIIAIAIFLIACCNFINLTIAIAAHRGKEIGVRKVAGASRGQLILQLLTETFLSVSAAMVLAVLLAHLALPVVNRLLGRDMQVSDLYQAPVPGVYLAVAVASTLVAGLYPALLIAYTRVNLSIKSKVLFGGSGNFVRNLLTTGQFGIAVIFIVCLVVFISQMRFLQNKDLGYSYEQVIRIPVDAQSASKTELLRSGLLKVKGVTDVTQGFMNLGKSGSLFGIDYLGSDGQTQKISVNFENVAPNYVPFFNMKLVAGKNFTQSDPRNEYLVNETLAKQLGYKNPVGMPIHLSSWPQGRIVGVVKDFNYSSLRAGIEPLIIGSFDGIPEWNKQIYVKVATTDIVHTVQRVESTWKKLSGSEQVSWQFMDEHFKEVYRSEKQAGAMVAVIGGLSLLIACLGLFGLAAFVMARRTKEIGIRKVLGASVSSVVRSLSKEFMRLVLIAFVLAAPIAYWLANEWLQDFAYRVSVSWWMFAVAGGITVLIAFITVATLAIKAAEANPVLALRNE